MDTLFDLCKTVNNIQKTTRFRRLRGKSFRTSILLMCVVFMLMSFNNMCHARLFFTGPNPYLSSRSFPQDGLFFQGTGSYAFFGYNPRGWFGNLDEPKKLPSASYTMTSQTLQVTNPTSNFHLGSNWTQYKVSAIPYYFQYRGFYI